MQAAWRAIAVCPCTYCSNELDVARNIRGDAVIAEMTRNDCNWGTGLDVGHIDGSRPHNWKKSEDPNLMGKFY